MNKVSASLKVFFQEPFWIGIFESECCGKFSVCKVTFGAEPKDCEIYEFVLKNYYNLRFSSPVFQKEPEKKKNPNPKRIKRQISRQMNNITIGTKAQNALKLQHEELCEKRKKQKKENKEEKKARLFEIKRQKRKEKHRGR